MDRPVIQSKATSEASEPAGARDAKPAARARGRRLGVRAGDADTRVRILDAAEISFALHGFDGVTVRHIAKLADIDVALVYYYFASKRSLFDQVFERRAEVINRDRMASLDAYDRDPGPGGPTVEGVFSAFLRPVLERAAAGDPGWRAYFAIVALVNNTPVWGGETMTRFFDPVIQKLAQSLRKALPDVREDDLYWSYHFLSGALTLSLSVTGRIDRLSGGACNSADFEAINARLARFAAGGLLSVAGRAVPRDR
jgi:AcrR family transcriptional regulator